MAASTGAALTLLSSDTLIQRLRVTELKNVVRALGGRISGNCKASNAPATIPHPRLPCCNPLGPRSQLCDRIRGYLMEGGQLTVKCRELLEHEYTQRYDHVASLQHAELMLVNRRSNALLPSTTLAHSSGHAVAPMTPAAPAEGRVWALPSVGMLNIELVAQNTLVDPFWPSSTSAPPVF